MDTLVKLSAQISTVGDPNSLITWLSAGGLTSHRDALIYELETKEGTRSSGVQELKDIVELYKLAEASNNRLAYALLLKKIEGRDYLHELGWRIEQELKIVPCQKEFLKGWTLGRPLGSGAQGEVWDAIPSSDGGKGQTAVLKRAFPNEGATDPGMIDEATAAIKASELKVGPAVYKTTRCSVSKDWNYLFILQQKLSGPTLDKIYPLDPAYVIAALEQHLVFLQNTPWDNEDLYLRNIMYDQGRVYIIDYGLISERKSDICESLRVACLKLLTDLTETAWRILPDRSEATRQFLALADSVSTWYYTKCPTAERPLRKGHKEYGAVDAMFAKPIPEAVKEWLI